MNLAPLKDTKIQSPLIQFSYPDPRAQRVCLAGDFNNWDQKSMPMRKGSDGIWRTSVPLKPGRHEYRFLADGVWQNDPAAQQKTANIMGSENCVRIVAG